MLDVNLNGVAHGCRAFGRQMVERGQGGHIVNVASMAAYLPVQADGGLQHLEGRGADALRVPARRAGRRGDRRQRDLPRGDPDPDHHHDPIRRARRGRAEAAAGDRDAEFALRGYPPERVAEAILGAVLRNRAVVPVAPEAHLLRLLARLSPAALRVLAQANLLPG